MRRLRTKSDQIWPSLVTKGRKKNQYQGVVGVCPKRAIIWQKMGVVPGIQRFFNSLELWILILRSVEPCPLLSKEIKSWLAYVSAIFSSRVPIKSSETHVSYFFLKAFMVTACFNLFLQHLFLRFSGAFFFLITHMKKLLDSDWLTAV